MPEIIYKEESYKLMRILFDVHNTLGPSYQEKHYHRAIKAKLVKENIPYEHELKINLSYEDGILGEFFADFLIDNKIILEVKKSKFITSDDRKQLYRYLRQTGKKLGIIANFGRKNKLQYIRIINL